MQELGTFGNDEIASVAPPLVEEVGSDVKTGPNV